MLAPVALFVYNRPEHTRRTVEALQANVLAPESDLFVYSDAPNAEPAVAKVKQVREYINSITGFKSVKVIEKSINCGVDRSIIAGVSELCNAYGSVIVLEDDLVTSPWFLRFMNEALLHYRNEEQVMQITGSMFPIGSSDDGKSGFLGFISSWGWATWKRAWDQFDPSADAYITLKEDAHRRNAFDLDGAYAFYEMLEQFVQGKLDAWDIRWYLSVFACEGLALFPTKSLVTNIGFDGSGVHCPASDFAGSDLAGSPVVTFPAVELDTELFDRVKTYLRNQRHANKSSLISRARNKLQRLWVS